ncbi:hypothetical protein B0H13DRAFT_1891844 [Mycena leptocephala]|nr:hypothetical protein B0H13DRAFT_1891844 [Mycena leptocephala]
MSHDYGARKERSRNLSRLPRNSEAPAMETFVRRKPEIKPRHFIRVKRDPWKQFSGFTETEYAAKARIIVGDWLTSNNIRGARRDRKDDINDMERLAYVEELKKPNYAGAKALIRHSLIARILYEVIKRWADLAKWKPMLTELKEFAQEFVRNFTEAQNIDKAKNINDDYYAHSQCWCSPASGAEIKPLALSGFGSALAEPMAQD